MFVCPAILLSSWIAFSTSDNHLWNLLLYQLPLPLLHIPFSLKQLFPYYPDFQVSYPVPLSPSNCLLEIIELTSLIYVNLFFPFDYFLIARAYQVTMQKVGQCTWPIGFPSLKTHHTRLWSNLISTIPLCPIDTIISTASSPCCCGNKTLTQCFHMHSRACVPYSLLHTHH